MGIVCVCVCVCVFSCSVVSNSFAIPWTAACQAPLSMGFPKQEYWSGLPFPLPGIFPPGINLRFLNWEVDSLPLSHLGSQRWELLFLCFIKGHWGSASVTCWKIRAYKLGSRSLGLMPPSALLFPLHHAAFQKTSQGPRFSPTGRQGSKILAVQRERSDCFASLPSMRAPCNMTWIWHPTQR